MAIFSIRGFQDGDETALREVFVSALHAFASRDYSPDQIAAWEWATSDPVVWKERVRTNRPFVAEAANVIAGFADVQPSGFINQFFVGGAFGGQGVGNLLMTHNHQVAATRGTLELAAHVSLRAEGFFAKWGFVVAKRREVTLRSVQFRNALMIKDLSGNGPTR